MYNSPWLAESRIAARRRSDTTGAYRYKPRSFMPPLSPNSTRFHRNRPSSLTASSSAGLNCESVPSTSFECTGSSNPKYEDLRPERSTDCSVRDNNNPYSGIVGAVPASDARTRVAAGFITGKRARNTQMMPSLLILTLFSPFRSVFAALGSNLGSGCRPALKCRE